MLSQNNNIPVIYSAGEVQDLIDKAKAGDKHAFGLIYKSFLTPLYRYVLSRCNDVTLTDDICQTTFLRFYEALPRYSPTKSPLAYLFTIARNLLINEHQKMKPEYVDQETLSMFDDPSNFVEEIDTTIEYDRIKALINELSSNEQDVIHLFYHSELEFKEIALIMDQREDWVRQTKHRALKKLQSKVKSL